MPSDLVLCDHTRPVELHAVRPRGARVVQFVKALPRHHRRGTDAAGELQLDTEQCEWLLPSDPLPTGLTPAPGDTLRSADAIWLVQSSEPLVAGTVWRCRCLRQE